MLGGWGGPGGCWGHDHPKILFLPVLPFLFFPGDQAMSSPPRFLGEDSKWLPHSNWGDLQRLCEGAWDGGGDSSP